MQKLKIAKLTYWQHSFWRSMERAEWIWRHDDKIWQLVKILFC